ncbi:hypothetical protein ACGFZB_26965 [Streptomyces cinerochromogenes]|uniref:Uncharacterized protein n=1 Tax=Streptomyces cinerochromogenes TaxID=66422 RepID=A0ABW7B9Y3_9ACTN
MTTLLRKEPGQGADEAPVAKGWGSNTSFNGTGASWVTDAEALVRSVDAVQKLTAPSAWLAHHAHPPCAHRQNPSLTKRR